MIKQPLAHDRYPVKERGPSRLDEIERGVLVESGHQDEFAPAVGQGRGNVEAAGEAQRQRRDHHVITAELVDQYRVHRCPQECSLRVQDGTRRSGAAGREEQETVAVPPGRGFPVPARPAGRPLRAPHGWYDQLSTGDHLGETLVGREYGQPGMMDGELELAGGIADIQRDEDSAHARSRVERDQELDAVGHKAADPITRANIKTIQVTGEHVDAPVQLVPRERFSVTRDGGRPPLDRGPFPDPPVHSRQELVLSRAPPASGPGTVTAAR
jgi:hypothetical protein